MFLFGNSKFKKNGKFEFLISDHEYVFEKEWVKKH